MNRRSRCRFFSILLMISVLGCGQAPNSLDQQARKSAKENSSVATESQTPVKQRELTIAAASDLKFALDEIIAEFQAARPEISVEATYGSSGNFFAQISND